jgi:predicted transcriptional regulator
MEAENGCNKFIDLDDVDSDAPMEHACTIIRGEVVIPKEQKTVVEFTL